VSVLDEEGIKAEQKRERAAAISNGDSERAAELEASLAGEPKKTRPSRKQAADRLRGRLDREERGR
jgi:hypothetical protein